MEFHIDNAVRGEYGLHASLFSLTGNVVLLDMRQTRELAAKFNARQDPAHPERFIRAGHLYVMGLIDEILHYVTALYREQAQPDAFETCLLRLEHKLGGDKTDDLQNRFTAQFPPRSVYTGEQDADAYLNSVEAGESCRSLSLEETMLLSLANLNPAFRQFKFLFDDKDLSTRTVYPAAMEELRAHFKELPPFGPDGQSLWDMLRAPALASPDSLVGQLEFMMKHWGLILSKFMSRILVALDVIKEEEKPGFGGPGPSEALTFSGLDEYERFSPDQDWMPKTVLMAKSTLVWLYQLSKKYGREITRLDHIPDEELDELARRGFTGLWLIGLWERSNASKTIKQWTGNPEAAASAYSLYDYDIAGELGGWEALTNLRERCRRRGIRLGSDMVPNHTGIDSRWLIEHPDRFLQLPYPPFPTYNYNCGNLSGRDDVTVQIEEHYFTRSDAAVVFKRIDNRSGETRYIYHGNDGTSMPWNDTAQIDFLNPEAREAVIRTIIGVCQQFSIVRFDAAMTLAKRHIQRLWYPAPGTGGAIASRAEHSISTDEFNRRIPNEFWREVVDRCAAEAPNTLLLAEAFWMMEGYFVRTLGMHRVYNSAFMNMLKNEDNAKYRATIKNTLEFDPEILKRFVNFMNNPDEETAVAQFGKGDKYFGICTLLVTMPGLPMFGHGQIEGFEEKYGMEYRRAYRDEQPDSGMVDRHEREIFPLMKRRALFSGSSDFRLFDLYSNGSVNENVFAYTNRRGADRSLVFYNNSYYETSGWIKTSDPAIPQPGGGTSRDDLCAALSLRRDGSYFVLLREQRSNQWFIRSSKDISENGFFVSLGGYEAQVYLDMYEVQDDERGRWARLHHDLQGRGVSDPWTALMDIYLGELYWRFTELFKPEIVNKLHDFFGDAKAGASAQSFIDSLQEPAEAFFAAVARYITGADGAFDPWNAEAAAQFTPAATERVWKAFADFVSRLIGIAGKSAAASKSPADRFLNGLAARMRGRPLLCAAGLAYGALSSLRLIIGAEASGADAVSLGFDHWRLDRKLCDQYRNYGASDDEARRIAEFSRAVLARTAPRGDSLAALSAGSGFNAGQFAVTLIKDNYLADDFRRLIGINVFDDVTWFNKEGFENLVFYAALFAALESDGAFLVSIASPKPAPAAGGRKKPAAAKPPVTPPLPWAERVSRVAALSEALLAAEADSGYRLDGLINALSGETGATAKTAAKPAKATPAVKAAEKPVQAAVKSKAATADKAEATAKAAAKPAKVTPVAKAAEKPGQAAAKSKAVTVDKAEATAKVNAKPTKATPAAKAAEKPVQAAVKTKVVTTDKAGATAKAAAKPAKATPVVKAAEKPVQAVAKPKAATANKAGATAKAAAKPAKATPTAKAAVKSKAATANKTATTAKAVTKPAKATPTAKAAVKSKAATANKAATTAKAAAKPAKPAAGGKSAANATPKSAKPAAGKDREKNKTRKGK
jgi:glycosidase